MLSLGVWTILLVSQVLLTAWAVARAARAVGSRRGRFRVGLLVLVGLFFLGVAETLLVSLLPAWFLDWVVVGALLVAHLAAAFVVIRIGFRLPGARGLVPLGAMLGMTLIYVGFSLLVVRAYVIEAFSMPTKAMAPAIAEGDRFFVNKLLTPRRWDLVAYKATERDWVAREDVQVTYCKRLVGLPGERLRFENGQVYVNDQLQAAPPVVAGRYTAALPRGVGLYVDGETIQLGPGEIFVIGDNVDVSADSRLHGPSDRSHIVGVVDFRYWPFERISLFR